MIHLRRGLTAVVLAILAAVSTCAGQDNVKDTLQALYDQTLEAVRTAKTTADLDLIVSRIDAPEWTSVRLDGTTRTVDKAETILALEPILNDTDRPIWRVNVILATHDQNTATTVAWIYKQLDVPGRSASASAPPILFGTEFRDKWILTGDGWRRTSHQKLFGDRVLNEGEQNSFPP